MERLSDAMLYLGNENSDPGHIKCSRASQVPTSGLSNCKRHQHILHKHSFISCGEP